MLPLVLLGLLAGLLTTVAGMGGGLFLIVALGVTRGPHVALALSAPALLLANLHRAWLFRAHLDRGVASRLAAGAIPGAILGAVVMQSLVSGMVLMKVDAPVQDIVVGIVLVVAVAIDTIYRRRST